MRAQTDKYLYELGDWMDRQKLREVEITGWDGKYARGVVNGLVVTNLKPRDIVYRGIRLTKPRLERLMSKGQVEGNNDQHAGQSQ